MSSNASSNTTLPSSLACESNYIYPLVFSCFNNPGGSVVFAVFGVATVLLVLPMCGAVLWRGFRRGRFSARVPSSQSDVFVFYMVATEVVSAAATVLLWSTIYTCSLTAKTVGYFTYAGVYHAQQFFHCLTCVERYVAVVHPITYLGLRASGGLRVRHISSWAVWLLCVGLLGLTWLTFPEVPVVLFTVTLAATIAVSAFCSLAVLHNLLHPKVGSEGIDQSKLRAFYRILFITGTLVLRSIGHMIYNILSTDAAKESELCVALMLGYWLCFPSIFVVPLLYLHKQGALAWFRCTSKPGKE